MLTFAICQRAWLSEMGNCFLCGRREGANLTSDYLSDYFTDKVRARIPQSPYLCDFCTWAIKLRCWYWNENRKKWVKLFARAWSSLFQGNTLLSPVIAGERTEGKDTLPIVSSLATRAQMREWILSPPDPPFTIAISESGQKHILPWAQDGLDRDFFPVQFELDSLWVSRAEFTEVLGHFEALMALDFSKTEILTGEYHSDRLMRNLEQYAPYEAVMARYRGGRLLQLINYVAQKPEEAKATQPQTEKVHQEYGQLTLLI